MDKWNYEVSLKELQTVEVPEGRVITSRLATVDTVQGNVLGLVGNRYRLVQNKTLYDVMEELGKDLDLKIQNVEVVKNRRATIFRYGFGDSQDRIVDMSSESNDKVKFGVEIFNSFDSNLGGSCIRFFANRLVCLNGMVIPKDISRISLNSFDNINSNSFKDNISNRMTPILDTAKIWNRWAQITPNRTKVGEFISSNLGKKVSGGLLEKFDTGKDKSIWGLYNLLTYYISHEVKSKNSNDLRLKQWERERIASKFYTVDLV